jgi:uncharacterized membrane protein YhaH (DUF805 family)
MGLFHYLFSFEGRINRAKQWAILLVGLVFGLVIGVVFSFTVGFMTLGAVVNGEMTVPQLLATPQAHIFAIVCSLLYLLGFYIGLAVMAKRLHDRNKSAWWLLVFVLLPTLLNIPAFLAMPVQLAHLGETIKAVQHNLPPPMPPVEPPLATISRAIATLISLWAFVELYIFRGTVGDNRYGPDPLAGRG